MLNRAAKACRVAAFDDGAAIDRYLALLGGRHTVQRFHERGLATAAAAHQCNELARRKRERCLPHVQDRHALAPNLDLTAQVVRVEPHVRRVQLTARPGGPQVKGIRRHPDRIPFGHRLAGRAGRHALVIEEGAFAAVQIHEEPLVPAAFDARMLRGDGGVVEVALAGVAQCRVAADQDCVLARCRG